MIDWGWYSDPNTKSLFIHCLLMANWKENEWKGIVINRGQFVTGIYSLAEQTGLSVQQIRTALVKLKSTNEITIKTTSKYSIITVLKYEAYQEAEDENNKQNNKRNNKQITNKQQTNNKQITTTEEGNKEIKKEEDTADAVLLSREQENTVQDEVDSKKNHSKIVEAFFNGWKKEKGFNYVASEADFVQLKNLIKKVPTLTAEEFLEITGAADSDPYYQKNLTIKNICSNYVQLKLIVQRKALRTQNGRV